MVKKSFKLLLFAFVMISSMFFAACTLDLTSCKYGQGTAKLTFEAWGGVAPEDVLYTAGVEVNSSYFKPATKFGYDFLYWCNNSELTSPVTFPFTAKNGTQTFYAKYEIDDDYFDSTGNIMTWYDGDEDMYRDWVATTSQTNMVVLLDKVNLSYDLSNITVEAINESSGQSFTVTSFLVFDENGKPVENISSEDNVFEPQNTETTYRYVLHVIGTGLGKCRININGENPLFN